MGESVQKLTHIEHVLKRPDSYVGPVDLSSEQYWIHHKTDNKFKKKSVNYSPALLKILMKSLSTQLTETHSIRRVFRASRRG
jgi:hypothetical protein